MRTASKNKKNIVEHFESLSVNKHDFGRRNKMPHKASLVRYFTNSYEKLARPVRPKSLGPFRSDNAASDSNANFWLDKAKNYENTIDKLPPGLSKDPTLVRRVKEKIFVCEQCGETIPTNLKTCACSVLKLARKCARCTMRNVNNECSNNECKRFVLQGVPCSQTRHETSNIRQVAVREMLRIAEHELVRAVHALRS